MERERIKIIRKEKIKQRADVLKKLNDELRFPKHHQLSNLDEQQKKIKREFTNYLILEAVESQNFKFLDQFEHEKILRTLKTQALGKACDTLYRLFDVEDFEYAITNESIAIYFHETNELLLLKNNDDEFKELLININVIQS